MKRFISFLFTTLLASTFAHAEDPACYDCRLHYSENTIIKFKDFSLEYTGVTEGKPFGPNNLKIGSCYNFKVITEKDVHSICWSSGTGDIGPVAFSVGDKCFAIEKVQSDKFGKLGADEIVVQEVGISWCRTP